MLCSAYSPNDAKELERLFLSTFTDSAGSAEGKMVGELSRDLLRKTGKNDLYCFVARDETRMIGGIIFSRIRFESGIKAFILSPVAVRTGQQGKGIGQRLIRYGLEMLSNAGVELVLTYGDPAFYSKVGFQAVTVEFIPSPLPLRQPEGWQALSLTGRELAPIAGKSTCVEALNKPGLW